VRLFLAASPDARARRRLAAVHEELARSLGDAVAAVRWVTVAAAHLTVHFLGEVDASRVPQLIDALGDDLPVDPFDVALGPPEASPVRGLPRVVWMPVTAGREPLSRVHDALGARLLGAGRSIEARPFTPHLTIGRVRDRERDRASTLRARLDGARTEVSPIGWHVDRVTLFRSDLSGPSPVYDARHTIALGRRT
jgi:RNA 2',3'-cyclic 3'-phosphodiesterase